MYICERCGYSTTIKCNLKSHLSRKKICPNTYSNKDVMYLKNALIHKLTPIDSKLTPNEPKMTPIDSKMTPVDSHPIYVCQFCKQKYSKNSNLHRHMKKCTQNKIILTKEEGVDNIKLLQYIKLIEKENKLITKEKKAMRKEIEKLIDKVGDTTNIMNNTINIVAPNNFTQENLDYLTGDYLDGLLKIPYGSILDLLRHIHFNPNHPENHNIKIPNRKEKFAIVYSKGKWELRVKKEVIGDMVDTAYNIIDCHYDEVKNTLEFGRKDRFNNYKSSYDTDNKTRQKIETDVELVILNEKEIETLKLMST